MSLWRAVNLFLMVLTLAVAGSFWLSAAPIDLAAAAGDPPAPIASGTASPAPDKRTDPASPPELGDLFIMDKLLDNGDTPLFDPGQTSLGDLLILNALFNDGRLLDPNNQLDLSQLFILDRLLDSGQPFKLDSGRTSLADILFLRQLLR